MMSNTASPTSDKTAEKIAACTYNRKIKFHPVQILVLPLAYKAHCCGHNFHIFSIKGYELISNFIKTLPTYMFVTMMNIPADIMIYTVNMVKLMNLASLNSLKFFTK